jgi:hypothetical protein
MAKRMTLKAPEGQAVDGERGEGAGPEGAQQEPYGQVCGDSGDHDAEEDLAVDVRAWGSGE